VRALLLAALLGSALPALAVAQDGDWDDAPEEEEDADDEGGRNRFFLTAWGGAGIDAGGNGSSGSRLGGEAGYSFSTLDLSVAGYGYRHLPDATREWTPVVLARVSQRFQTHRGLDAAITFGVGSAKRDGWKAWFQVGLGARLELGPMFLAGELTFEQEDQLGLMGGLGARF
jgi:hypothetical protein